MNIAIAPEVVLAAQRHTVATTAEALKAAQAAVESLVALKSSGIFGVSPAGKSTDAVFGQASTVIDELISEVNQAIDVLNQNLKASVDAILKGQEVAQVDYAKLTQDNASNVDSLGTTGIKPGDETYVAPKPRRPDGPGAAPSPDGPSSPGSSGSPNPSGSSNAVSPGTTTA